jgi:hypothetical protein
MHTTGDFNDDVRAAEVTSVSQQQPHIPKRSRAGSAKPTQGFG